MAERYLHHPNFGLLYVVCVADHERNLFTTLYAHRLFFLVTERVGSPVTFEAVSRAQSRQVIEERIRQLRKLRDPALKDDLERVELFHKQIFL